MIITSLSRATLSNVGVVLVFWDTVWSELGRNRFLGGSYCKSKMKMVKTLVLYQYLQNKNKFNQFTHALVYIHVYIRKRKDMRQGLKDRKMMRK